MKKLLFLLLFLPMMANAQVVNSVYGAEFGSSYSSVVNLLRNFFGESKYSAALHKQNEIIAYFDISFKGFPFQILFFKFVENDSNYLLNETCFFNYYKTTEEVYAAREKLIGALSKTFKIEKVTDSEGYVEYCGGLSPTNPNEYAFHIEITETDGEDPYHLNLVFGPFDYGESE